MPLIYEAEAGSACASVAPVGDAKWDRVGGWRGAFLEYVFFSWLMLALMLHICVLRLLAKTFLFEFIYLFGAVTPGRRHSHRSRSVLLTFSLTRHAALEKEKTHIVEWITRRPRTWDWMGSDRLKRSLINNKHLRFNFKSPSLRRRKMSEHLNRTGVDIC